MSSNHNPAVPESQDDSANKRAALAGQWRTPPMPVYPTSTGYGLPPGQHAPAPAQQHTHMAPAPPPQDTGMHTLPPPSNIPSNSEDYAKALQEAYRKGAEAAARMAQQQQQQQQIPTAASCPNFSTGPHSAPPPPAMTGESVEDAAYSHQVHPTHTSHSTPDPLASSSMPPPPPPQQQQQLTHLHHSQPHAPPAVHHHHHHHHAPPPPPSHHHNHYDYSAPAAQPPAEYSSPVPQPHHTAPPKAPQGRSLSMPDMSTYAAQAEEEKRQKRLARNRASARLRRLRKKNLVRVSTLFCLVLRSDGLRIHHSEYI